MFLFIDESGTDEKVAPCVVLGGISISEENMWRFELAVRLLQREIFGIELREIDIEIKGKRLLKSKTFRHARQGPAIDKEQRRTLARDFLVKGYEEKKSGIMTTRKKEEYTAYGQAAIDFVDRLLDTAGTFGIKTFGSIVKRGCPQPTDPSALRKDYNYLLERFYYYLETFDPGVRGILVCDELEPNQSYEVIKQISNYFERSTRGQIRSNRIVPIPFFVHSHLTTAIQLADLVCYITNWSVRVPGMNEGIREELHPFGQKILDLQFTGTKIDEDQRKTWPVFGFYHIKDLRTASEKVN
jgi:hypothetical protein